MYELTEQVVIEGIVTAVVIVLALAAGMIALRFLQLVAWLLWADNEEKEKKTRLRKLLGKFTETGEELLGGCLVLVALYILLGISGPGKDIIDLILWMLVVLTLACLGVIIAAKKWILK